MVGIHPTLAETMTMFPAQRFDAPLGPLDAGTVLDPSVILQDVGGKDRGSRVPLARVGWSRKYWAKHRGYSRDTRTVLRGGILQEAGQVEPARC